MAFQSVGSEPVNGDPAAAPGTGSAALAALPPATADAVVVFGDRLDVARSFGSLLAGVAVQRGLIGPRETPRLWDRHLVNCAVISELVPAGARVVDIGSGAGLPGIALACLRTDVELDLVDSLQRRTTFLSEAVQALGLADRVRVHTGRAEDPAIRSAVGGSRWVTARAVAPLERLAGWSLPLLVPGGWLLALKGSSAEAELRSSTRGLVRVGAGTVDVVECGKSVLIEPTRVVRVQRISRTGASPR